MNNPLKLSGTGARALAAHGSLEAIAQALGCPVEAFYTGEGMPADLAARSELLALWDALTTAASREAVLKLVRAIVANE